MTHQVYECCSNTVYECVCKPLAMYEFVFVPLRFTHEEPYYSLCWTYSVISIF